MYASPIYSGNCHPDMVTFRLGFCIAETHCLNLKWLVSSLLLHVNNVDLRCARAHALKMPHVVFPLLLFTLKLGLSLNGYYEVYNNLVRKAKICINNLIYAF